MDGTTTPQTNKIVKAVITARGSVQSDVGTALEHDRWMVYTCFITAPKEEGGNATIVHRLAMQNFPHGDMAVCCRNLQERTSRIVERDSQSNFSAQPMPEPEAEPIVSNIVAQPEEIGDDDE